MNAIQPNYIWMASGELSNLSPEKFKPLQYRKIILFPDLNAFDKWTIKADELKKQGF